MDPAEALVHAPAHPDGVRLIGSVGCTFVVEAPIVVEDVASISMI